MAGKKEQGAQDEGGAGKGSPEAGHKKEKARRINIIRLGGRDLNADFQLKRALSNIRGLGFTLANAIARVSGLGEKKVGELSEDELKRVEDMLQSPGKYGIPSWMFNRRFDPEKGLDSHLISAQLELRHKMDINELKKGKSYRGVRHINGLPVRGQRTRSSFRTSASVGVSKSKTAKTKK